MSERWKRLAQGGGSKKLEGGGKARGPRGEEERQRGEGKGMEWMSEGVFF